MRMKNPDKLNNRMANFSSLLITSKVVAKVVIGYEIAGFFVQLSVRLFFYVIMFLTHWLESLK